MATLCRCGVRHLYGATSQTRMISKERPLVFTHIPKTGGMSMFASMCEYHGMKMADLYNRSANYNESEALGAELSDTDKCVYAGHFPFGLHEWLTRPCYYMAMVRDPLDRILSLYRYSMQYRAFIRSEKKRLACSYDELFERRVVADFYRDFMPWVKGEPTISGFLRCRSAELDNGMVRRFSGVGLEPDVCPDDALVAAKDNIARYYSLVGLQERYQESMMLARVAFSVNFTEFHINRSSDSGSKKLKLSLAQRKRIKDMNRLDIQLYGWIAERFAEQLEDSVAATVVSAGGRTDYDQAKLWHAIGSSPIRQAVMRDSPNRAG